MSKFEECIDTYKSEFNELGVSFDEDLLRKVAKGLGPSIYNTDASKVSSTDTEEMNRVRDNFLKNKLGLTDNDDLQGGLDAVVEILGSSNRNKYRAMFYYLLTKHFNKESVYND